MRLKSRMCIRAVEKKGISRCLVTFYKDYIVFIISGSYPKYAQHDTMTCRWVKHDEYSMTYLFAAKMASIYVKTMALRKERVTQSKTAPYFASTAL